jgi:cytochrome P450 family 12
MIRKVNLFRRESFFQVKSLSTKTAASFKPKSSDYDEAKPFEEIPGPTKFETITRFMPGGRYHKASMTDVQNLMRKEFGDFYRIPGMFGQGTLLTTFDPDDIEYLFRNDGFYPYRRGMLTMKHFREKIRPDIYDVGGLVVEYD